jgi:acyl-CoA thioesterase-1
MTEDNLLQMTQGGAEGRGCKGAARRHPAAAQLWQRLHAAKFEAVYSQVASANKAALVPFLLKGVADAPDAERRCSSADRIHPTERGTAAAARERLARAAQAASQIKNRRRRKPAAAS